MIRVTISCVLLALVHLARREEWSIALNAKKMLFNNHRFIPFVESEAIIPGPTFEF